MKQSELSRSRQLYARGGTQCFAVRQIYYKLPQGRSTLEVLRNYEASLGAKSFRIVFSCASSEGSCFERNTPDAGHFVGVAVGNALTLPRLASDYVQNWFEQRGRYLLAQLDRPEGTVYVSISLGESSRGSVAVVRQAGPMPAGGDTCRGIRSPMSGSF